MKKMCVKDKKAPKNKGSLPFVKTLNSQLIFWIRKLSMSDGRFIE